MNLDKRRPIPIEQCRFSFLNIDMGRQRSGVENASLLRAVLFSRELGISPSILTARYNPRLRHAEALLRSSGLLPEGVPLHNMYDDLQAADRFDPARHSSADLLLPVTCPPQNPSP
ncbi:hypothetical protein [Chelativorans intermedius]|uniref:Uncharacterized protein n=1 Tax=Chelativorans intermedius TaxID=515947 RepID=A0ABV6D748_9HYPH|nr:hypothetical protein [Chelativorans intermedius]MCT8999487.1 hypothetical protein [Chelativorans intermedius]